MYFILIKNIVLIIGNNDLIICKNYIFIFSTSELQKSESENMLTKNHPEILDEKLENLNIFPSTVNMCCSCLDDPELASANPSLKLFSREPLDNVRFFK